MVLPKSFLELSPLLKKGNYISSRRDRVNFSPQRSLGGLEVDTKLSPSRPRG